MDLSVIIPARNEEFLKQTIESVLSASEKNTEVIAILDGYWPDPAVTDHKRVTIIHHSESIGQRAATNEGVKYSQAKYVMKLDAHCSLGQGFDRKLIENCEPNWTVIPRMYVLDAFHWVCKCGKHYDQGPEKNGCDVCGSELNREMIWTRKKRKRTDYMWFDTDLRIKYFDGPGFRPYEKTYGKDVTELKHFYSHKKQAWTEGDITDVMVGIGACWFMHRDWYWELEGMDEAHGSWGQMAVELACKTWLSGGRQIINKNTWFAHLPRTQDGFGFPYPNPGKAQQHAREYSRNMWTGNNWPKQKHNFNWLIDKFGPLPGWDKASLTLGLKPSKGMVYYTTNRCEERIASAVRKQLLKCCNGHPIISVSQWPIDFGENIVVNESPSVLTMFKQILLGLEAVDSDIVFLVEHDVIYHPSHFDFVPTERDVFYYNLNTWKVRASDGQAVFYKTKQTSGLCADRQLLIEHYRQRVDRVGAEGFTRRMGFEPGTHKHPRGIDNYRSETWMSEHPNVDVRHSANLTANRFKKSQFRSQRAIMGWTLADEIPYWGKTKNRFNEFLKSVSKA